MCICHKLIESSICGSNIQHFMLDFHKENKVLQKNKCKGILPTIIIKSLKILNSFASGIYIDDIAHMICRLHHLHLD